LSFLFFTKLRTVTTAATTIEFLICVSRRVLLSAANLLLFQAALFTPLSPVGWPVVTVKAAGKRNADIADDLQQAAARPTRVDPDRGVRRRASGVAVVGIGASRAGWRAQREAEASDEDDRP
jgi:hypothetical protein